MNSNEKPTFYLGLCMAGAISAGAYTAGVVDYLIEALDRWEQARKSGDPRVPSHQVVIDTMTGASAGGMTAAIATAALHDHIDPVNKKNGGAEYFKGKNKLYQAWVDLTADEMLPKMLDSSDLPEYGAASVLNSNFVDAIAQEMLQVKEVFPPRAYVSEDLEICLSLSNLTGFQEVIRFDNDSETKQTTPTTAHEAEGRYIGINHRDFGYFVMGDTYSDDGRIPVSFKNDTNEGLRILRDCAMATGAFPVGLRWRSVQRPGKYIRQNPFINYKAKPMSRLEDDQIYASVNVDGGLLNNEPFEIAQRILATRMQKRQAQEAESVGLRAKKMVKPVGDKVKFSVLMIEPFPTIENGDQVFPKQRLLLRTIIGQIYSTMRTQLRFKQKDLQKALKQNEISRYIIAPTRQVNGQKTFGSKAIACGSLGGFGGFLTKRYRVHDFQLGRYNCQRFLQEYFRVEVDTASEIFKAGYSDEKARQAFAFPDKQSGQYYLPIIPDINPELMDSPQLSLIKSLAPCREPLLDYPTLAISDLRKLLGRSHEALKNRLYEILIANGVFSNFWVGLCVRLFKSAIMGTVAKQIEEMVIEDLYDHDLVEKNLFQTDQELPTNRSSAEIASDD